MEFAIAFSKSVFSQQNVWKGHPLSRSHFMFIERYRVLYIDNAKKYRDLFRCHALNENLLPSTAATGLESIHILKRFKMDCIICDFSLPDFTAIQLRHALLHANSLTRNVETPLLVTSEKILSTEKKKALVACGIQSYCAKTSVFSQLYRTIDSICKSMDDCTEMNQNTGPGKSRRTQFPVNLSLVNSTVD